MEIKKLKLISGEYPSVYSFNSRKKQIIEVKDCDELLNFIGIKYLKTFDKMKESSLEQDYLVQFFNDFTSITLEFAEYHPLKNRISAFKEVFENRKDYKNFLGVKNQKTSFVAYISEISWSAINPFGEGFDSNKKFEEQVPGKGDKELIDLLYSELGEYINKEGKPKRGACGLTIYWSLPLKKSFKFHVK